MMLKPALRPPMRAPMRSANSPREGVGVSRASQIIASAASGITNAPGSWSNGGGATRSLEVTNVRRPGISVVKFLAGGAAADQYIEAYIKIPAAALTGGRIDLQLFIPKSSAGTCYLEFRYSSDTPSADPPTGRPTNRRLMTLGPDKFSKGKWSTVTIDRSGKLYSGGTPNGLAWAGSPDSAEIEWIGIAFGCSSDMPADERYFLIDTVSINGYRKPFVMLGGDGFSGALHSTMLPLWTARGFRGYLAGDGDLASANAAALGAFYSAGSDIISQGMNHTNYASNPSLLDGDCDTARGILDGLGFIRARKWFTYPNSAFNQATIATLDGKGVKAARATNSHPKITISELGNSDFTQIGAFDLGQKTAAQMIAWLDDIIRSGEGMITYLHALVTAAANSLETTQSEYVAFLDYLKTKVDAGLVDVITPNDFELRYL